MPEKMSLYSARMRASANGKHISGAERIVHEENIRSAVDDMVERAFSHGLGKPDSVSISIDRINSDIARLTSLPIRLLDTENTDEAQRTAILMLESIGIDKMIAMEGLDLLIKGASPGGGNMRGAVIMDPEGDRLEPDRARGVRVTRMDFTEEASKELNEILAHHGLSENYVRIKEALALATKVVSVEGTIAELCISDNPDYTTGYVSSKKSGYVRIPNIKEQGETYGGRIFFVRHDIDIESYTRELEEKPVLLDRIGKISR